MQDRTSSAVNAHLAVLRRRWRVAVGSALVVLALLVPFVLGLPALYRASSTILVEGSLPTEELGLAEPGGELDQRLQAIKQEALSRARLKDLIDRTYLVSDRPAAIPAIADLQRDIRLEIVSTSTTARGQTNTVAFKLSYVGRDPETVAKVTNTLADFYVEQNNALRSRAVTDTAAHLKEALETAKASLEQQERRLARFTSGNAGSLPQQSDANQAALMRLNLELQSNLSEQARQRDRRQSVMDRVLELKANPPADAEPELRLARLRKELADLRLTETENGPNVRAKVREVEATERQVAAAQSRSGIDQSRVSALEAELGEIDRRLTQLNAERDRLRQQIEGYQARLDRTPSRSTALQSINHEYETARDLYDSLQKRYDAAVIAERAERNESRAEFRVLDAALTPTEPSGPNRLLLCLGALFAALVTGIGLAYLVDLFDTSFHDVDDLRAFTHVPVLASIPLIAGPADETRGWVPRLALVSLSVLLVGLGIAAFLLAQDSDGIARLFVRRT